MFINVVLFWLHEHKVCSMNAKACKESVYAHIWLFQFVFVGANILSTLHYLTILSDYAAAECSDFHSSWNSTVIYIVTIIRLADNEHRHICMMR